MASSFDEMSALWDTERGAYRPVPLADALNRGGPFPEGLCVEVGCGTGLLTPLAEQLWEPVVGIELSAGMLARGRSATRLRADASFLPLRSGVAACVLIADSLLFAGEVGRVLGESGVVVWSNALGREAPYHVPSETLLDVLTEAAGGRWRAVESEAGWGSWAVFHRLPSE
jgi:SAM-dependent methyltransferase